MGSSLSEGEEPEMPSQADAAPHFFVDDEQRLKLIPQTPTSQTLEMVELDSLFEEIQEKTAALLEIGHNFLGDLSQPVQAFNDLIQEDRANILVVRLWLRGNALRKRLAAHDDVGNEEFNPAKLNPNCSERLRDLVEAFNVYVANDPKAALIDRQRLGESGIEKVAESWSALKPFLNDSRDFASKEAIDALDEMGQSLEEAVLENCTESEIALSENTAQNFVAAFVTGAYRLVRRALGDELPKAWTQFKAGVYNKFGTIAASGITTLVINHYTAIMGFFDAVAANPTLQILLNFMLRLIS